MPLPRIEAVLFAYGEPIKAEKLAQILELPKNEIIAELTRLKKRYDNKESGIVLLELGGSYQIATKPEYAEAVKSAIDIKRQTPLSQAAMEVLAIISYNQPVSKAFIEKVRGIDSSSVVNTLCERGLVEEAGRLDLPGRPIAYRTTAHFLRCFGMKRLSDLPPLPGEEEQLSFQEET
ncbi:MAG: SMC-Scp complex subunit ScpB [Oscillospiraceae bacterium]|nr:SMC-Scp complex subunit ScpB [Oscillospiraceae bacterium]